MKKSLSKTSNQKKSGVGIWISILGITNILAFIGVVVINYLAVSLPLGGMSTGELSDLYPNLFVPAGLTFSIWGVIYLLLFGFSVWQLFDLYKKNSIGITKKIGVWFILSCIANISWIFAWHYQYVGLSVIVMLVFLFILIMISNRLSIGNKIGNYADKWLVQVPFSVYLGRISVATIANISTYLINIGWNMWGVSDITRTIIVIIVATLLALISLRKNFDIIYALVIIRAFIGIILKRISVDPVYATPILWTLGVCITIITGGIGWRFLEWNKN